MESGTFFITTVLDIWWCEGPLSSERWAELRCQHLVEGARLYGAKTYAWHVRNVRRISGVPCEHSTQVTWVIYRGVQWRGGAGA